MSNSGEGSSGLFEALGLKREAFSTTPDPAFFYPSLEYKECLQRLEISIRLRRGLSVILGDVGLGKTSFSRLFLGSFQHEGNKYIFRLMLDPGLRTESQFLNALINLFEIKSPGHTVLDRKNALEHYLFQQGVEEGKVLVLIVDEGQKLTPPALEVLRTLLNYETNQHKLLQLVILAQMEFLDKIKSRNNFMDRITMKYVFKPLDEENTQRMIEFRLEKAGLNGNRKLFTDDAYSAIYQYSQGFPRRINNLCHHALISMLIKKRKIVDEDLVKLTIPTCEF